MNTLLFCVTPRSFDAGLEHALGTSLAATRALKPDLDADVEEVCRREREPDCAFFFRVPRVSQARILGEHIDSRLLVLAFGEIWGEPNAAVARIVAEAWAEGGADAVRRLEGCFSAIVVERVPRRLVLPLVMQRWWETVLEAQRLASSASPFPAPSLRSGPGAP